MTTERLLRWKPALIVIAAAGLWYLFFAVERAVNLVIRGRPVPAWEIGIELLNWVPWIVLTPLVLWVLGRWPIAAGWRAGGAHALASVAVAALHAVLDVGMVYALAVGLDVVPDDQVAAMRANMAVGMGTLTLSALWKYWAIAGVFYAFDYHRKYREREVEAARLEQRLTRARLQALRLQIQPHFLFNTLHSISMLNLTDTEAANRLLVRLGDLMRAALEVPDDHIVPLEREIELIERYLEIESLRLSDRLSVEWDVDEEALSAEVPNLVLQPLVENAIRHGIAARSSAGRLAIRIRRENGRVVFEVEDDGPGTPEGWDPTAQPGVGLSNTAERLRGIYGDSGRMEFERPEGGGFRVRVDLPVDP